MKGLKKVVSEIKDTTELRHVIEAYEEVAAGRMQKIREGILVSREFYDGLIKITADVGLDLTNLRPDKARKEAVVFVSANAGLYGDIIQRTFALFVDYLRKNTADVFIVGKLGGEMLKKVLPQVGFSTVEISDEKIEAEKFGLLADKLMAYERITTFYGRFGSVVNQFGYSSIIPGEILREVQGRIGRVEKLARKRLKYLYEPTVESISQFFGNEILTATFEAMLREAQLAKFGSRLMHLDMAINKIEEKLETQSLEKRKVKKRLLEKKQRQALGGVLFR